MIDRLYKWILSLYYYLHNKEWLCEIYTRFVNTCEKYRAILRYF